MVDVTNINLENNFSGIETSPQLVNFIRKVNEQAQNY